MELIHHICERDIFKLENQNKTIISLENLASKQKTFQIVKEHTSAKAPRDHTKCAISQHMLEPGDSHELASSRDRS